MTDAALFETLHATWPAAETRQIGQVCLRIGLGGGSRVSAATVEGDLSDQTRIAAENAMRTAGQTPLFMIRPDDRGLDATLTAAGYAVKDPTVLYAAPISDVAQGLPETPTPIWPPTQAQIDIWASGGIDPERIAVMERATCHKAGFLIAHDDQPAGTVYAGATGGITMLHALEIAQAHRRRGLAAKLTRAVAHWGAAQGDQTLALATTRGNVAANALYTSLGMLVVGEYHYRILPDL